MCLFGLSIPGGSAIRSRAAQGLAECQARPRLFADVAIGPRNRLEALVRDRVTADDRDAIRPVLQPSLSLLDRLERLFQILPQGAVSARLLEPVGLISRVFGLIGRAAPVLLKLALDPSSFLGEALACVIGIHAGDPTCGGPRGASAVAPRCPRGRQRRAA